MKRLLLLSAIAICIGATGCCPPNFGKATSPDPVAIGDLPEGRLYWLDIFDNKVYQADANGQNARVVVSTERAPDGIAVDQKRGWIYWTNMGSVLGFGSGSLQRSRLDGSGLTTIIPSKAEHTEERLRINTPKQLRIDLGSQKLYWCDREGAKIWRSNTDGSDCQPILSEHGMQQLVGLALDPRRNAIYFTDRKGQAIYRMGLAMPSGQTHRDRTDVELILSTGSTSAPIDLDLDRARGQMYWTDRSQGKIYRAKMDVRNQSVGDATVLVDGLAEPIGIDLELGQGKMYYTTLKKGEIWIANLDGSDPLLLTRGCSATGIHFSPASGH